MSYSGNHLRALISASGLTYEALANSVNAVARENGDHLPRTNRSTIHRWRAGAVPDPGTRAYIAEALSRTIGRRISIAELGWPAQDGDDQIGLSLTEDPVTTLRELAHSDLHRRTFLSAAAYSVLALADVVHGDPATSIDLLARTGRPLKEPGQRIGSEDVQAVRAVTASLTALDERLGGRHGRDTVTTWLANDVTAMCQGTFMDERVRGQMFSAAAEVAYLAGWKAHDAGLESLAQRYYQQAYQLAGQNSGSGHDAYVLRIMAHHALDIHQPQHSLEAALEAWRRASTGGSGPRLQSLFAFTVSRAHATSGDARQAGIWLARAERLTGKEDNNPVPSWVSLGGSPQSRMNSQAAKTLSALGQHGAAEPLYARSASRWNPGTYPRVRALTLHNLAVAQAEQGHVDHACATWVAAIDPLKAASGTSARVRTAISDIRARLTAPRYQRSPAVQDLIHHITT